ncbi:hypothetical protein [Methylobacterium mesophilicum]|uniref:hypothetical protein n=1 Tax=Methylobacterium mesophilicum TaxID=39956 RepID=UPI0002C61281|nr:hypothetical protein [Methylobacterium mesophilicum]
MLQSVKNTVRSKVAATAASLAAAIERAGDALRAAALGLVPAPAPVPVRVRARRTGRAG